jgi:hypothetical protein
MRIFGKSLQFDDRGLSGGRDVKTNISPCIPAPASISHATYSPNYREWQHP